MIGINIFSSLTHASVSKASVLGIFCKFIKVLSSYTVLNIVSVEIKIPYIKITTPILLLCVLETLKNNRLLRTSVLCGCSTLWLSSGPSAATGC